jgi:hypothetical protein
MPPMPVSEQAAFRVSEYHLHCAYSFSRPINGVVCSGCAQEFYFFLRGCGLLVDQVATSGRVESHVGGRSAVSGHCAAHENVAFSSGSSRFG